MFVDGINYLRCVASNTVHYISHKNTRIYGTATYAIQLTLPFKYK